MDDDGHEHGFGLILSLDSRSRDFVLGVEMGRLWEQLKDPEPFEQTIHSENLEIVMRMMEGTDRKMRIEDCSSDETYCYLIVEEALVDALRSSLLNRYAQTRSNSRPISTVRKVTVIDSSRPKSA